MVFLPTDADPYLALAMADLCVGMPFTSPLLAGWANGRGGIYHAPLRLARYSALTELALCLTQSREELLARLEGWSHRGEAPHAPSEFIAPHLDPAQELIQLVL